MMTSFIGLVKRLYTVFHPPVATKSTSPKPLKFGILGAAAIAPAALILPALSHPEVVVYAVGARSLAKAQKFAKKHGIEKAYEGYQAVLDDPEVDVIYNPLPNGLHFEWTMKALAAGKHVLNEKPTADTADEARLMFEFAEKKGLVLLDAFHYRFHPALKRLKEIITSGELGKVKNMTLNALLPRGFMGDDDIRFDYSLGGGAMMDLGCYTINCVRFLSSLEPTSVVETVHEVFKPKSATASYVANVDRRMEVVLGFPNDITASIKCDLSNPPKFGFLPIMPGIDLTVEGELAKVTMFNYFVPTYYHYITVTMRGGHSRVEKVYKAKEGGKGEEWWTTYRYQLEALVDRLRGREPDLWLEKEDSVATMEWIEKIYEKSGLGSRPKSEYVQK